MAGSFRGLEWYHWLIVALFGVYHALTTGSTLGEHVGGGVIGLALGYVVVNLATWRWGDSGGEEKQAAD